MTKGEEKSVTNGLDPFAVFDTDPDLEREGAEFWFGGFYLKAKCSGHTNYAYSLGVAQALRPIREALKQGRFPNADEVETHTTIDVFARHVLTGWGGPELVWSANYAQHPDYGPMPGYSPELHGQPIEFSAERGAWLLKRLPHLWGRIRIETANLGNYRAEAEALGKDSASTSSGASTSTPTHSPKSNTSGGDPAAPSPAE